MIGKYKIGIIQGRLSRPVGERIQAFPAQSWDGEFASAKTFGLDSIEWIFEEPAEQNPLFLEKGRRRILELISSTGVKVDQVCADYFMEHPFFRVSEAGRGKSLQILKQLIPFSKEIGAQSIEIPLLDNSRIESDEEMQTVVAIMKEILPVAAENGLTIAFETSLPPVQFAEFMNALDHPNARVVYDIGNSASLGYDATVEIELLGKYLSNVHLKDRLLGGSTVPLGTGNARFEGTFAALNKVNYNGSLTLQVARGEPGNEIETTKAHLEFLKKFI